MEIGDVASAEAIHAAASSRHPAACVHGPRRFGLPLVLVAIVVAAMVFVLWPQLDLATSSLFYDADSLFAARGWTINHLRRIGDLAPFIVCVAMIAAALLRWAGVRRMPAPGARSLVFLVVSFVVGPGLIVNVGLKDHSHRPRPSQVAAFGGAATFQPFYRFDGACDSNCSFVSGEVSSAAWTLAPALLAPPPWRAAAVVASLVFALAMSLLRIAAGGHFLSDAVFAILFTALIVLVLHRLVRGTGRGRA